MPGTTLEGSLLYARLKPLAAELRRRSAHQAQLTGHRAADCLTDEDFVALSETCVFQAFRQLTVRNPARPTQGRKILIDPTLPEDAEAIIAVARRLLVQEVQGSKSNYGDYRSRQGREGTLRGNRCVLPCQSDAWTAWRHGTDDFARLEGDYDAPQEVALVRSFGTELEEALRKVLSAEECDLMFACYLDEKRQREIAAEMAATDPRYAGPDGFLRAETLINVKLSRARRRAKKLLPPRWAVLVAEVA